MDTVEQRRDHLALTPALWLGQVPVVVVRGKVVWVFHIEKLPHIIVGSVLNNVLRHSPAAKVVGWIVTLGCKHPFEVLFVGLVQIRTPAGKLGRIETHRSPGIIGDVVLPPGPPSWSQEPFSNNKADRQFIE